MARPSIPEAVKREVRQRCGFGCVICGLPIYDYEHMMPYADVQQHEALNITLLCPNHHRAKTNSHLTIESVWRANETPYNLSRSITKPYGLDFGGEEPASMQIGGNMFVSQPPLAPLIVEDFVPIFFGRNEEGLSLNINFRNRSNIPTLVIRDNAIVKLSGAWDIEFVGQTLTLREGPGQVTLRIEFVPPNIIRVDRAKIWFKGAYVDVAPEKITMTDGVQLGVSGCMFSGCHVGISFGRCGSNVFDGLGAAIAI